MNKIIRTALVTASLAATGYAAPFMAIGDGAELFLTGTLGVRVDDNILLGSGTPASPEVDDIIFDINPGLDLTFGKDAQLKGSLAVVYAFANYADNDHLNTDLFGGDFNTAYDDGKLKLNFDLGYHELNQNTPTLRGLIRRDVFSAGGNAEVELSQITAIGVGLEFDNENYKRAGYTDLETLTVPVNFYYKWTPKIDVSAGYRFRDEQVDLLGQNSKTHFFNVGARGEFSPKFTGKFAIGLNQREFSGGGDETGFGLDSSFAYEISPKTTLQFGATNDFATSPQGLQQENLTLNGLVSAKVTDQWGFDVGLSWRSIDYSPSGAIPAHTDDFWESRLGTSFIVSANLTIVGSYVYRNYNSDFGGGDFKNNVFSVAANLRY